MLPRGSSFEVGAIDDGVGGGRVGVANKQWWPIASSEVCVCVVIQNTYYL